MASFVDQVPQFSPYVSQLPVEAMVKVGMEKQKRYEENVTKIQSYIDNIAGLDIMRDVDRGYLQNKLNELGNNLKIVVGSDFSNFQLVNSVAGMAGQVAKDKFIQAAVQSTAHHRKEQTRMDEDRKNGKLTPDNEDFYKKRLMNYLTDPNLGLEDGSTINFSASYIPNFDIWKFAKETFDAVKPDGFSFDEVYITDGQGKRVFDRNGKPVYSPVLVRLEKEGLFPAKVRETLNQIFSDPRVGQQLRITGEYNFKGLNAEGLMTKVNGQREASLAAVNAMLLDLNLKKTMGQDVTKQMDDLLVKRDNIIKNYNEYANLVNENPDAVRGQLYRDDVFDRYTTMFGWTKTKETQHDNPGWKANFELQKEANEQSRFAQKMKFDVMVHRDNMYYKGLDYNIKLKELDIKLREKGMAGTRSTELGDQDVIDAINKVEFDYDESAGKFKNAQDGMIWSTMYANDPAKLEELNNLLRSGNFTKEAAIANIINRDAKTLGVTPEEFRTNQAEKIEAMFEKQGSQKKGSKNLHRDMYNNYVSAKRSFQDMKLVKDAFMNETDAISGTREYDVQYGGKNYKLTPEDIGDIAVYYQGARSSMSQTSWGKEGDIESTRSKKAYERLKARGLQDVTDYMVDVASAGGDVASTLANPLTGIVRGVKGAFKGLSTAVQYPFTDREGISLTNITQGPLDEVVGIAKKLNSSEYMSGLEKRVNAIKNVYGIAPNLNMEFLTGDTETDKRALYNLNRLGGNYSEVGNLSYDYKNFMKNLPTAEKLDEVGINAQSIVGVDGKPRVEIVIYNKEDNKRVAGLTLTDEEAMNNFNISVDQLYEPKEISILKNRISVLGGKSSVGPVDDVNTYKQADYVFDNKSFPGLTNNKSFDVKVNFSEYNGNYYPFVYINDGTSTPFVTDLPGVPNLTGAVKSLQQYMTPQYIQEIINDRYGRKQ